MVDLNQKAGDKYFQEKDYEKAIEFFTKAIDSSHKPIAYINRGKSYKILGNVAQAEEDIKIALELMRSKSISDPKLKLSGLDSLRKIY